MDDIVIQIRERDEVISVASHMSHPTTSIETITLKAERYHVSMLEQVSMEELKDWASRELAKYIMDKLEYHSYSSPEMMGQRQATFSIYDCTTSEKEIFNKRIKSYQDDITGRDLSMEILRRNYMEKVEDILAFENETLWMMIKRWGRNKCK